MSQTDHGLLEERLKLWDYFVSDEIVKLAQGGELRPASDGLGESHLEGDLFFEVLWELNVFGERHQYVAVIERPKKGINQIDTMSSHGRGDLDAWQARENVFYYLNRPVLVDNVELMQDPQHGLMGIGSVIWLHSFDDISGSIRHMEQHSPTPSVHVLPPPVLIVEDWKRRIRRGFVHDSTRQLPDNMVKRGPQIMGSVTNNQADFLGQRTINLGAKHVPALFAIELSGNSIRLTLAESLDFEIKIVQMFVRPLHLQPGPIEWMVHG